MKAQKKSVLVILGTALIFFAAGGAASGQNLVKNGSFENLVYTTPNGDLYNITNVKWNAYPSAFINDLGWTSEWRTDVATWLFNYFTPLALAVPVPLLEVQANTIYGPGANADDGAQWAELDSDWTGPFARVKQGLPPAPDPPYGEGLFGILPDDLGVEQGSTSIYQILNTLPGAYELSFAFAARPGSQGPWFGQPENKLEVRWNGQPLMFSGLPYITLTPAANVTDPLVWTKYTVVVQATGVATELRFTDLGYADGRGTLLDSVAVTRIEDGCTRTQGYWKTHSKYGPAARDEVWSLVEPDGEDSPFFGTGYSWIEILNMAPKGNAYLILAHQYIAAKLNVLSGASTWKNISHDDFVNNMAMAESLLSLSWNVPKSLRKQYIDIAEFLTEYNEGVIGPGHCFEECGQSLASPLTDGNFRDGHIR